MEDEIRVNIVELMDKNQDQWAGMILRNHTYLKVYKCWQILPILKTPTIK